MRSFPDDSLASRCKLLYLRHFREIGDQSTCKVIEFESLPDVLVKGNHCGHFKLFVIL